MSNVHPLGFGGVRVANILSFMCCPITRLYVLCPCCDVRYDFRIVVFLFCLTSSCVLCTLCCQFLWMVHFWLPLQNSLTFSWRGAKLSYLNSPMDHVRQAWFNLTMRFQRLKVRCKKFMNDWQHLWPDEVNVLSKLVAGYARYWVWVSDCCLTPIQQVFNKIMARTG